MGGTEKAVQGFSGCLLLGAQSAATFVLTTLVTLSGDNRCCEVVFFFMKIERNKGKKYLIDI